MGELSLLRPPELLREGELATRVAGWRVTFRQSQALASVGVVSSEPCAMAAVLLAAWAERRRVVLPADGRRATLAQVGALVNGWVGDVEGVEPLKAFDATPLPAPELAPDFEGLTVFTSGSTGLPLAVHKRWSQLAHEVESLEACFGAQLGGAALLSTVSPQHLYGLLFTVLWPLASGRALPARVLDTAEAVVAAARGGSYALVSSPAFLKRLPPLEPGTALRAVFSSGAPLPSAASVEAERLFGVRPIEILGSSETGGLASRRGDEPWQALPSVSVRVDSQGWLEVQSPFLGQPGWVRTADRAERAGEGFRLLGRGDRVAKVEDKRVSLEALEQAALETGLLAEVRALVFEGPRVELGLVGCPEGEGSALWAKGKQALVAELKRAFRQRFDPVLVPRRYRFVEALPVNAQGKVVASALAALFRPERPAFEWRSRGPDQALVSLQVTSELRCLDGHFPEVAIVPGVAQVDWAVHCAAIAFGVSSAVIGLEALKFQSVLRVGDVALLHLERREKIVAFRFEGEGKRFSSGRLVLT